MMHNLRWPAGVVLALSLVLFLLGSGCKRSAKDDLHHAHYAMNAGEFEQAKVHLLSATSKDPGLIEAKRSLIVVALHRGEFAEAEILFERLWKELEFETWSNLKRTSGKNRKHHLQQPSSLHTSPRDVAVRASMVDLHQDLYTRWALAVGARRNPLKYEEILRSALQRINQQSRLQTLLAEFYGERAQAELNSGALDSALVSYQKAESFHPDPKWAIEAHRKAEALRLRITLQERDAPEAEVPAESELDK